MEGLVTHLAFMWFLPSVDQEVLLQVSQLGEAFVTGLAFERSLSTVDTKMNLHSSERERKVCLDERGFVWLVVFL